MNKTRLSLYYLATYLWLGGIGLMFFPRLSAKLLLSITEYPPIMLQSLGMFMIGLGIVVIQIIRFRIHMLYSTTLIVRLFFCACLMTFYVLTANPFFMVLFSIVALGVLITGISYLSERSGNSAN